jgi:hypothetical protein
MIFLLFIEVLNMKRLFALILIACLGTISLVAQPKLEIIGGDTYDWKFVKPNDSPLQAKVQIKNTGDKTLEITNVKPGCGCTTAPLDKNSLKPGEIATMDIKLNISGNTGKVTKSITISSNDPNNEKKVLYLKAEIIRALMTSPTQYLTYSDITVGKEAVASLKIKNNSNQDVTLSNFEVTPETVTINLKNKVTLKPGQEVELEAKVKPEKKGYLNMTVKMNTTHPDHPEFVIQGYGNVKESAIFNSK